MDFQDPAEHPLSNQKELFEFLESLKIEWRDVLFLDVGCGKGEILSAYVMGRGGDYVGVDRGVFVGEYIVKDDMHDLSFSKECFDFVLFNNALEHSISPYLALYEAARVLRVGGGLLVGLPVGEGHDFGDAHFLNLSRNQVLNLLVKVGCDSVWDGRVGEMWYYKGVKKGV